ncbi:MAG: 4Fe-4S dicluster domain-containing protein [Solirubrobacterales bacterium]
MEVIERESLDALLEALQRRGFTVVGPTVRDQAIVYDELSCCDDLPAGWTDEQDGGTYRLVRRQDEARCGYVVGPRSWKHFLHPPRLTLFRARRNGGEMEISEEPDEPPRYAFLGVRSCDLHAIATQDRVLMGGEHPDPHYVARREGAFIIAIQCGEAGGTCFCVSMETGPKVDAGYDLALTEVLDGETHHFVVEVGSARGAEVLAEVPSTPAEENDQRAPQAAAERAASQMGREMETDGIKELLYRNYEHPRWDEVSERCLTCGNCTMVCPTCFCTTVEDVTDLTGTETERQREWDSCFTMDFSYVHGGSVRASSRARYRQWMTHKLASWADQFDSAGCVGCGRCITWCPVAIDITEEAAAIRATDEGLGRGIDPGGPVETA